MPCRGQAQASLQVPVTTHPKLTRRQLPTELKHTKGPPWGAFPGGPSENQEVARPRCNQVVVGTLHISLVKLYTERRYRYRTRKKNTLKRGKEKTTFLATNSIHCSSKSCRSTSRSHLMQDAETLGIGSVVSFSL